VIRCGSGRRKWRTNVRQGLVTVAGARLGLRRGDDGGRALGRGRHRTLRATLRARAWHDQRHRCTGDRAVQDVYFAEGRFVRVAGVDLGPCTGEGREHRDIGASSIRPIRATPCGCTPR